MPFAFFILGLLFLVIAIQGTQTEAFGLVKKEFTGNNNFVVFGSAILVLGSLAFIKPIRPVAMALIGLVLLGMFLKDKGGFFKQLNDALRNPTAPDAVASSAASSAGSGLTGSLVGGTGPFAMPATAYPSVTTPGGQSVTVPPIQTPWAPGAI